MKKINVLCAMRNDMAAQALAREMDDEEHLSIRIVHSGDEAYAGACRFAPDILVLDAVLPGMDGLGVVDRLRVKLGSRMPRVIGGAMLPMASDGFFRRGARQVLAVPWEKEALCAAILGEIEALRSDCDWTLAQADYERACALLRQIGVRSALKGFDYLAWAAALACGSPARMDSVSRYLYVPIAKRFDTTEQSVERLIRHAIESAMNDAGAQGVYGFFGNTIDPTRGKPTNAQVICALAERMRIA